MRTNIIHKFALLPYPGTIEHAAFILGKVRNNGELIPIKLTIVKLKNLVFILLWM